MSLILDIGCGVKKHEGATGVDKIKLPGVDYVCDLNGVLPFKDSSVDGMYLHHILEHVEDVVYTMEELYRISKPGAWLDIRAPHSSAPSVVWSDPTHKRGFSIGAFSPFMKGTNVPYYSKARFNLLDTKLCVYLGGKRPELGQVNSQAFHVFLRFIEKMANLNYASQIRAERWWAHWIGFSELYVRLEADK